MEIYDEIESFRPEGSLAEGMWQVRSLAEGIRQAGDSMAGILSEYL